MSDNFNKPILDLPNPRQALEDLQGEYAKLHDLPIGLGIQRTNMITGFVKSTHNDQFFLLRDSILYRRAILFFHLDMLLAVRENHLARLADAPFNSPVRDEILFNGGEQQFGLFDSLTFHSISLFDYLGNLIDFVCSDKRRTTLKWPGVVSACRDNTNSLSKSPVASTVVKYANDFVNKLYDHRSDLIHYSKDLGEAVVTFDPMSGRSDFRVFAPNRFVHSQSELRKLSKDQRITLIYVGFWVVRQTLEASCSIVNQMFKHIEQARKIAPGKEFFIFRPPLKDESS